MNGYIGGIEDIGQEGGECRPVLFSGMHLQLTVMSLKPGDEFGGDADYQSDRFFRIESGMGRIVIDGAAHRIKTGDVVVVPAGANHKLVGTGDTPLRIYMICRAPVQLDQFEEPTRDETFHLAGNFHSAPNGIACQPVASCRGCCRPNLVLTP